MAAKSKKATIGVAAVLVVGCLALGACTSSGGDAGSASDAEVAYSEDSLMGYHDSIGQDITGLTEVSEEACTGSGCHGGSYEAIREATEDYWEGIGQISDANPHESHASAAFACEDCHTLSDGAQVNVCNQCHDFDTPLDWVDKAADSTQYGLTTEEPLY